jgi:glycosyltransferase involved in cell wall biosynthesis
MENRTISVVIPVYRGEKTIPELIERLGKVLPQICTAYEVILVNDGSPDQSWQVINQLADQYPWVNGLCLMRNFSQQNATLCGIQQARYEIIVTMDDDLQHQPELIPSLLEPLDHGFDVVYGTPNKLPKSFLRNLITKYTKKAMASIIGIPAIQNISAFRVFRASLRQAFNDFHSPDVSIDVLLSWGTTKFTCVYIDIPNSRDGSSNYNLGKLIQVTMQILTSFSSTPLKLASYLGFGMFFLGLILLIYIFIIYFTQGSVPGFPFLASIIAIFSGAQLFSMGIFGEYLARMFERSMNRPPYIINAKTENKLEGKE